MNPTPPNATSIWAGLSLFPLEFVCERPTWKPHTPLTQIVNLLSKVYEIDCTSPADQVLFGL